MKRYYGGNSGYLGYSKSLRAIAAEREGLRSISNFDSTFVGAVNKILAQVGAGRITIARAKKIAKTARADEWHHTSMYGNRTNYYSPETVAIAAMSDDERIAYYEL